MEGVNVVSKPRVRIHYDGSVRNAVLDQEEQTVQLERREEEIAVRDIDRFHPPCEPEKIVCIGRNYRAHIEERGKSKPDRPAYFLKPPNTLSAHRSTVSIPANRTVEVEAELAYVISKRCRNVKSEDVSEVLEGVTCVNDLSNRDDQDREQNWVRGKAFDGSLPIGPGIVPLDQLPGDAVIQSRINGQMKQNSTVREQLFDVREILVDLTRYMTLEPGDVIATGTPYGVAEVSDGDRVEIKVEGVGSLYNTIRKREDW